MEIVKVDINELISPEYNPRQITDDEMEKLKNSINEFGYVAPIIVNKHNNHIVGGNQRYEALKSLGYTDVDVVFVDEPDLNREKALNIALNKISGDWDNEKLTQIFNEMSFEGFDITLTGFEDFEINDSLGFFDDNFDDSDIEEGGADENFDNSFSEVETYTQEATFENHEGDVFDFGDFELKIKNNFLENKMGITLYQDTFVVSFDNYMDEDLLKDFINRNDGSRERLRDNGKLKSDIYG